MSLRNASPEGFSVHCTKLAGTFLHRAPSQVCRKLRPSQKLWSISIQAHDNQVLPALPGRLAAQPQATTCSCAMRPLHGGGVTHQVEGQLSAGPKPREG